MVHSVDVVRSAEPLPARDADPTTTFPTSVVADQPHQLKALGDRTRMAILDLVLERAASVTELAAALGKPKSTVAHHVEVLRRAGLLRVVRTRRVRAVTEAFYGRTGRTIMMSSPGPEHPLRSMLDDALAEQILSDEGAVAASPSVTPASRPRRPTPSPLGWSRSPGVHPPPREGDVVYGLIAGVYPTAHAGCLPPSQDDP